MLGATARALRLNIRVSTKQILGDVFVEVDHDLRYPIRVTTAMERYPALGDQLEAAVADERKYFLTSDRLKPLQIGIRKG